MATSSPSAAKLPTTFAARKNPHHSSKNPSLIFRKNAVNPMTCPNSVENLPSPIDTPGYSKPDERKSYAATIQSGAAHTSPLNPLCIDDDARLYSTDTCYLFTKLKRSMRSSLFLLLIMILIGAGLFIQKKMNVWHKFVITPEQVKANEILLKKSKVNGDPLHDFPIPAILHQTWKRKDNIPEEWADVSRHCQKLHSEYTYYLWTDELAREFIAKEYPDFLLTFDTYPHPVQRADALRYFVIYHYGGIYLDMDVGCAKGRNLDPLRVYENAVIIPKTSLGFSNDVLMATPRHAFMKQLIEALPSSAFDTSFSPYFSVLASTGPLFLTFQYYFFPDKALVHTLPGILYSERIKDVSFFSHIRGSSWHEGDAQVILILYDWLYPILLLLMMISFIMIARSSFRGSARNRRLGQ